MAHAIYSNRRRWSDNDHHFGPFTFTFKDRWRPFTIMLCSGSTDHDNPGCNIRFQAFGFTVICELPQIIKPWRQWVDLRGKSWASGDGYWDEHPREYGFCLNDGHLSVHLGAQTHDSSTTQDWGCFLPWREWRVTAQRIFNLDGTLAGEVTGWKWEEIRALQEAAIKGRFAIEDFDGAKIEVETYAEEWDRRLGKGWFKWLGYIVPMQRRRSLSIAFKDEVGPEKGSWKGGVTGHGIEMLPGETQEQSMRRYCEQERSSRSGKYRISFGGVLAA